MEIIDVTGIELPSLDKINKDIAINKDTYVPTDIIDYEVPLLLKDAEGKDFKWETLKKFVEKPDVETAKKYLSEGSYFWNSGIFMFKASVLLEELKKK